MFIFELHIFLSDDDYIPNKIKLWKIDLQIILYLGVSFIVQEVFRLEYFSQAISVSPNFSSPITLVLLNLKFLSATILIQKINSLRPYPHKLYITSISTITDTIFCSRNKSDSVIWNV